MFLLACVILFMGAGGLCMMSLPVWLPGPMFFLEGLSLVPCTFWGSLSLVPFSFQRGSLVPCSFWEGLFPHPISLTETLLDRDPRKTETPCTVKSRRYASYWNAFLFRITSCDHRLPHTEHKSIIFLRKKMTKCCAVQGILNIFSLNFQWILPILQTLEIP